MGRVWYPVLEYTTLHIENTKKGAKPFPFLQRLYWHRKSTHCSLRAPFAKLRLRLLRTKHASQFDLRIDKESVNVKFESVSAGFPNVPRKLYRQALPIQKKTNRLEIINPSAEQSKGLCAHISKRNRYGKRQIGKISRLCTWSDAKATNV